MKKVKFTLGLMLAILLLGANVINAAYVTYDNRKPHDYDLIMSFNVKANPHYNTVTSDWIFDNVSWGSYFSGVPNIMIKKDTSAIFWSPGYNEYFSFFSLERDGLSAYNNITVALNYRDGNDLRPVVRRTIVVGEWVYDDVLEINVLIPSSMVINDYLDLKPEDVTFLPDMDRKTGIATYVFRQNFMELFNKYALYSVSYEVSVHDAIGIVGSEAYEPPVNTKPDVMRGIEFAMGEGITTSIPTSIIGNTVFVPSYKHFTFEVYSNKGIVVTANRSSDPNFGIDVVPSSTKANTYIVTIKRVQSNFTVSITQVGSTSEPTGNGAIAADAVWAAGGTLYVNAASAGTLSIYSVTGQLIKTEAISGSYTISLSKGLYIVQLNGKAYKIIL